MLYASTPSQNVKVIRVFHVNCKLSIILSVSVVTLHTIVKCVHIQDLTILITSPIMSQILLKEVVEVDITEGGEHMEEEVMEEEADIKMKELSLIHI